MFGSPCVHSVAKSRGSAKMLLPLATVLVVLGSSCTQELEGPIGVSGGVEVETTTGPQQSTTATSEDTSGVPADGSGDGDEDGSSAGDAHASGASEAGDAEPVGGESSGGSVGPGDDGSDSVEYCMAPGQLEPCDADSDDPFHALGLNCPGTANTSIRLLDTAFDSPDPLAWQTTSQFGESVDPQTLEPVWTPREGEKFLIISTGRLDEPDDDGILWMPPGVHQTGANNDNPDDKQLPAPMSPFRGSNGGVGGTPFLECDGVGDCSDSLVGQWSQGGAEGNDLLWFQMELEVPGGTHGFSFDFVYFSAEFPEWVDTTFNDVFVVWSASETYTGNLCFVDDQPCTVTALWPVLYTEQSEELIGTGFDGIGGATGWFQAKGSAEPGEVLQVTWAIFDMGDSVWDTAVAIDNFAWDCQGCAPNEVEPCIGIDPI